LTRARAPERNPRVPRDALTEIAFDGLLVGMLLWQPLRDAAALALLALLLSERGADGEPARSSLPHGWAWPVAAFLAANALSAAASADPRGAFAHLRFYPLGLLVFLGGRRAILGGAARRIAAVVLALVVLFGLDEMRQVLAGESFLRGGAPMWGRFQGALVYPSDVSLLVILLPIGSLVLFDRPRSGIAALAAVVLLVGAAVSLSGTRAALGALLLFAAAAPWIHGRRAAIAAPLLAAALVAALATASLGSATVARRLASAQTYRAENRLPQWRAALRLFREAPLLGQGPHRFLEIVERRHAEPELRAVQLRYAPYPHDIYLEALCGTGLVGFAALAWLLAAGARSLLRQRAASTAARCALVSLAAFASVGLFDLSLVKDWVQLSFWLPLAFAAGLTSDAGAAPAGPTPRR
jgi:O-antigen ligase